MIFSLAAITLLTASCPFNVDEMDEEEMFLAQYQRRENQDKNTNDDSDCSRSSCTCSPYSCSPCSCCVPEPKKCIDCECYTPAYYDLQCACGFFVSVDFLYWYAREANLSYAATTRTVLQTFPNSPNFPAGDIQRGILLRDFKYLDTNWRPGFRVGIGWNSSCDGWDYMATWTYYYNRNSKTSTVPPFNKPVPSVGETSLMYVWGNEAFLQDPFYNRVRAKWKLQFNQIDLELGRKYWLSRCFNLRPYAGVRGAWTKTRFNLRATWVDSSDLVAPLLTDSQGLSKDRFTSRFWGVGILGGLQPTWYYTPCFGLYGNLDAALIWGRFEGKKRETYSYTGVDVSDNFTTVIDMPKNRVTNDFTRMQAILDLGIGIRWEDTWCCERYRTSLDVGWEHHMWFNHGHRYKYSDQFARSQQGQNGDVLFNRTYTDVISDLIFGGLVVHARFDF